MFHVVESECCNRIWCGPSRDFTMHSTDNLNQVSQQVKWCVSPASSSISSCGSVFAGSDHAAPTLPLRRSVLCRLLRLLPDVHDGGESSRKRHRSDRHGVRFMFSQFIDTCCSCTIIIDCKFQSLLLQGEAGPHCAVHGSVRYAQRSVLGLSLRRHRLPGQLSIFIFLFGVCDVSLFFVRLRLMRSRRRRSRRRRSSGRDSVRRCSRMPTTSS